MDLLEDISLRREPAAPAYNAADAQAEAALMRWIDRMDELISAETAALRSGEKIDFESFNAKKNHALFEFMIVSRNMKSVSSRLQEALRGLHGRLEQNGELLKQQLHAASEISKVLITAIRAEESDGTYTRRAPLRCDERF
jgi:hypothetical protein